VQRGAVLGEAPVQRGQRMMQPPAARGTGRPRRFLVRCVDVERHDAIVRVQRCLEGAVVVEAQVAAEPDDGSAHRGDLVSGRG